MLGQTSRELKSMFQRAKDDADELTNRLFPDGVPYDERRAKDAADERGVPYDERKPFAQAARLEAEYRTGQGTGNPTKWGTKPSSRFTDSISKRKTRSFVL
jgi:hypothetical protein